MNQLFKEMSEWKKKGNKLIVFRILKYDIGDTFQILDGVFDDSVKCKVIANSSMEEFYENARLPERSKKYFSGKEKHFHFYEIELVDN